MSYVQFDYIFFDQIIMSGAIAAQLPVLSAGND